MYLSKASRRVHDALAKGLIDKRCLIKGGFAIYRTQVLHPDAGPVQLRETEMAFFAGAQHLMACFMASLDPGSEPTSDDMQRMDNIQSELEEFADRFAAKLASPSQGTA